MTNQNATPGAQNPQPSNAAPPNSQAASSPSQPASSPQPPTLADIMALKESLKDRDATIERLTGSLTSERAARAAAEETTKQLPTLQSQIQALTSQLAETKTKLDTVHKRVETGLRADLVKRGIDPKKLESMNLDSLELLVGVLPQQQPATRGTGFDAASAGSNGTKPLSAVDKIAAGLAEKST